MRFSFVYLMTNRPNGLLYAGVKSDLPRRVAQHCAGTLSGLTKRYGLKTLLWFETHEDITTAIPLEKAIKHWMRADKVRLIRDPNPDWRDLWPDISA